MQKETLKVKKVLKTKLIYWTIKWVFQLIKKIKY